MQSLIHTPLLSLVVLLGLTMAGCSGAPDARKEDPEETIDRLRALGYVGFTDSKVSPDEPSVQVFDEQRSARGYNLISNRDLTSAQLFDPLGNVVQSWQDRQARHWSNAELLEDGSLLVTGSEQRGAPESGNTNFLLRMAWDGTVLWRSPIRAHHDAEVTPAGTIAALTFDFRSIPELSRELEVKDNQITMLTQEGEPIEEASLHDLLGTNPEIFRFQTVKPTHRASGSFLDPLHANSVEFMRHRHLEARDPIYAPTNVVVSFRHQDTVAIFDWKAKRLVWAWGQGEISGQHDATVLENGNILIFDNGIDRMWSRVIELDPLNRKIVWEYKHPDPKQFFSLRKGSSQRLPNGNTLIASSDRGEAFEVTAAGEIVWHFLNPNADDKGNRATIVRIKRYPLEFVHKLRE